MRKLLGVAVTLFAMGVAASGTTGPMPPGSNPPPVFQSPGMPYFIGRYGAAWNKGYLGVAIHDLDQDWNVQGLNIQCCALVTDVQQQSPAQRAGILPGDIVTRFAGQNIYLAAQLGRLILDMPAGRTVTLTVLRGGKKMDLTVTMGRQALSGLGPSWWPGYESGAAFFGGQMYGFGPGGQMTPFGNGPWPSYPWAGPGFGAYGGNPWQYSGPPAMPGYPTLVVPWGVTGTPRLGIQLSELTFQQRTSFGIATGGVMVGNVLMGSVAARAGFQVGDIIVKAGGTSVTMPSALADAVGKASGTTEFQVLRNGKNVTLKAELPALPKSDQKPSESKPATGTADTKGKAAAY